MLDLNDFRLFVHIVDRGGFTAASRVLEVPKSTLSHRITKLEGDLGARLLNRTSRHVGLTEAGQDFYGHAVEVLRKAGLAEDAVRQRLSAPCGVVRVTASIAAMQLVLNGVIADFLAAHPKVHVVAKITDAMVDIVKEGFDVAIRGHSKPLPDSNLVQRTIVTHHYHLFAGASYIAEHGEPNAPEDLADRPAMVMARGDVPTKWHLRHLGGDHDEVTVRLAPRLITDDVFGLQKAAIAGLGIVALPRFLCREAVEAGTLRPILPDWTAGTGTMTALTPSREGMLPSVRAFLDHINEVVPRLTAW
jgi:DNA-binding transcriptional LysR family regulator